LNASSEDDSVKVPEVSLVESSAEILYGLIHQRYISTRQGLSQMVRTLLSFSSYQKEKEGIIVCFANQRAPNRHDRMPSTKAPISAIVPACTASPPRLFLVADRILLETERLFCSARTAWTSITRQAAGTTASTVRLQSYPPPSMNEILIVGAILSRFAGAYFGTSFPHLLFQTYRESPSILAPSPTASLSSPEPPCDLQSKSGFMTDSLTPYNSSRSKIYGPRIYGFRVSERARSGPRMQWLRIRPRTEEQLRLGLEYREREKTEEVEIS
ncbi:casein kinase 2, beta polypeptide, partial [Puccinia sorghi]